MQRGEERNWRLLTPLPTQHGIANYSLVRVRRHGGSHKYVAKVLSVGHEFDLAVLTVEVEDFWKDMPALQLAGVPKIREQVICVGYPTGGDNISVTQGIVSRISMVRQP